MQTLYNDIVGLMYDIKELVTTYRGNLIALCVGIAVAVFNYNRPNAGMFFIKFLKKRSTVKNIYQTKYIHEENTFEENTVGITPTNSVAEGIFSNFFVCRRYEIFERSTISLGIISILLLLCCMVCCVCCIKKRAEVYILRNATGIDNHHHLRNSDENIPEGAAERGEMDRQEELLHLDHWATELCNRAAPGGTLPSYHHAQNLVETETENEML